MKTRQEPQQPPGGTSPGSITDEGREELAREIDSARRNSIHDEPAHYRVSCIPVED